MLGKYLRNVSWTMNIATESHFFNFVIQRGINVYTLKIALYCKNRMYNLIKSLLWYAKVKKYAKLNLMSYRHSMSNIFCIHMQGYACPTNRISSLYTFI